MFKKMVAAIIVVAALALAAPAAAGAADGVYTPQQTSVPTLAGTTAAAVCDHDSPWITYDVTLTDPENQSTGHFARLLLTDGTNSVLLDLGQLDSTNHLSGRVLWPGASVDAQGNATGWPGWELQNGVLVETTGNFAWTRGPIHAEIQVNPSITVPLSYPPATPTCNTDPPPNGAPPVGTPAGSLAATGLGIPVLGISILAVSGVFIGVVLVHRRRRQMH